MVNFRHLPEASKLGTYSSQTPSTVNEETQATSKSNSELSSAEPNSEGAPFLC